MDIFSKGINSESLDPFSPSVKLADMLRMRSSRSQKPEEVPEEGEDVRTAELKPCASSYGEIFSSLILKTTNPGTRECPSMILELGGGKDPRPYGLERHPEKSVITGNLDYSPKWGERQLQYDLTSHAGSLKNPDLNDFFAGVQLQTVVMGHTLKFLPAEVFQTQLRSIMDMLPDNGRILVVDIHFAQSALRQMKLQMKDNFAANSELAKDMLYRRLEQALGFMRNLAAHQSLGLSFQSYVLGPAYPNQALPKLRDGGDYREVAKKYGAKTRLVPVSFGIEQHVPIRDENKTVCLGHCEGVYELVKGKDTLAETLRRNRSSRRK